MKDDLFTQPLEDALRLTQETVYEDWDATEPEDIPRNIYVEGEANRRLQKKAYKKRHKNSKRACITEEALLTIKAELEELATKQNGGKLPKQLSIKDVLFIVGFNVYRGYNTTVQTYRLQSCPSKVARGTVYTGYVRNSVKSIDKNGYITYTNTLHPSYKIYEKCTVYTGIDVSYPNSVLITTYSED